MRAALLLPALLLVPACGGSNDDSGTGGVSQSEARQLDADAAAIDINAGAPGNDSGDMQ